LLNLFGGGGNIGGFRRAHALHDDRASASDHDRTDFDRSSWIARHQELLIVDR
jgi:hypothetical protein